jgi:hypothetical protein
MITWYSTAIPSERRATPNTVSFHAALTTIVLSLGVAYSTFYEVSTEDAASIELPYDQQQETGVVENVVSRAHQ